MVPDKRSKAGKKSNKRGGGGDEMSVVQRLICGTGCGMISIIPCDFQLDADKRRYYVDGAALVRQTCGIYDVYWNKGHDDRYGDQVTTMILKKDPESSTEFDGEYIGSISSPSSTFFIDDTRVHHYDAYPPASESSRTFEMGEVLEGSTPGYSVTWWSGDEPNVLEALDQVGIKQFFDFDPSDRHWKSQPSSDSKHIAMLEDMFNKAKKQYKFRSGYDVECPHLVYDIARTACDITGHGGCYTSNRGPAIVTSHQNNGYLVKVHRDKSTNNAVKIVIMPHENHDDDDFEQDPWLMEPVWNRK